MICPCVEFYISSCNNLLVVAVRLKAKCQFRVAIHVLILQKLRRDFLKSVMKSGQTRTLTKSGT
jgi:hypothetical protein